MVAAMFSFMQVEPRALRALAGEHTATRHGSPGKLVVEVARANRTKQRTQGTALASPAWEKGRSI